MARSGGDEDYEQITRANGVLNNRRLLSVWASQLQALSLSHSQTVQHTEQPSDSDSDSDLSFAESFDDAGGESPVTLADLDMLDCPICVQPLCSPIYQCEEGHIICLSCCVKAQKKCPSCCSPIGFIRCRIMEKLIESLKVECKNKRFGCKEMLVYHEKSNHEKKCPHTACFCPVSSCTFASSSNNLYNHFSSHHSGSATSFTYHNTFFLYVCRDQKHVILQEQNEGVIFILNHESQEQGRVFNVECIGPRTLRNAFVYQITFKYLETCLSLETVPKVCSKWHEHTPINCYLTIPSGFIAFIIEVCIKKTHPVV